PIRGPAESLFNSFLDGTYREGKSGCEDRRVAASFGLRFLLPPGRTASAASRFARQVLGSGRNLVLCRSAHGTGRRPLHPPRTSSALDLSRLPQPRFQLLVLQRSGMARGDGHPECRWGASEYDWRAYRDQAAETRFELATDYADF